MFNHIQRCSGIGMLTCMVAAAACQKAPSRQMTVGDTATASSQEGLSGDWRWVASEGGGRVERPTGAADSVTVHIGAYGGYREEIGGSTLQSRYSLAHGHLNELRDTAFTVLLLDSSRFFPRGEREHPAVAVRSLSGDTLVLSGTGTDATLHTFVRVDHHP